MARIGLERLEKRFPIGAVALHALDLDVADGELLVLVGPSGSGKSTVLRLVAGLETPTAGRILFDGRDVTGLGPAARDVAMVFQSYALYPHMTVAENLGFGLRLRKRPRAEVEARVREVADALGLTELLARRPAELSGGQRQRVALGRAIAREPVAFLLDEPLSNLDARLRIEMRAEIARLHRRLGATMVYVTHDQVEAMTLGDRVAVLADGALQQVAPPMELYRRPANRFVAEFLGSPAMHFVTGRLSGGGDGRAVFEGEGVRLELDRPAPGDAGDVILGLRPQELALVAPEAGHPARVTLVERLGSEQVVHVTGEGGASLAVVTPADTPVTAGDLVGVAIRPAAAHLFRAADGRRID